MDRVPADRTSPAPLDSYTRGLGGVINEAERQQLALQGDLFAPLAAWTFDTLGIGPGARVLEVGCGGGQLLAEAAERVGPEGRVVGIDRDAGLVAAARERVAPYPWAEVVEATAEDYRPEGAGFDAIHCRLVSMHQADPDAFIGRLIAFARPGGRIAVQEYDVDGATDEPRLTCHPPFLPFERLVAALWRIASARGTPDFHAGRKALARFAHAGLTDLRVQGGAGYMTFTDPRMEISLGMVTRAEAGEHLATAGAMDAAEFAAVIAEIRRAHADPAFDSVLVRGRTLVATVGTKPA